MRFGIISVLRLLPVERGRNRRTKYLCQCDCGHRWSPRGHDLRMGRITSCGCARIANASKPLGTAAFHYVFDMIRRGAMARGIAFCLTKEQVRAITSRPCWYCEEVPSKVRKTGNTGHYVWNGIDRVNSSLAYTEDNCVPSCEMCNKMKRNYTQDEFIAKVKKIALRFTT